MTSNSSPSSTLKLIVTGATGFIGSRLISSAKSRGLEVLSVIRSEEKGARLGIEKWVLFQELTSRKLVESDFDSAVIVHLMGGSRDEENCSLQESIVATTKTIAAVAKQARIKRIVYLSGY